MTNKTHKIIEENGLMDYPKIEIPDEQLASEIYYLISQEETDLIQHMISSGFGDFDLLRQVLMRHGALCQARLAQYYSIDKVSPKVIMQKRNHFHEAITEYENSKTGYEDNIQ